MDIRTFFEGPEMDLPRDRTDDDFERYISKVFADYLDAVRKLDPKCHLCARIQQAAGEIRQLCDWIEAAIREYLGGMPEAAYRELEKGIVAVTSRLKDLQSLKIGSEQTGRLFRIANTGGKQETKERLFHAPFQLRHVVGQHRYGIPGFPCLYLGGSLALCIEECRVDADTLPKMSIAEFALRRDVQILDFGYRPKALAKVAAGSAMRRAGQNPKLEDFIVHYVVCWPLIAASSIKVKHDGKPFVYEYIIPQMILQWVMRNQEWDGIRYFSSRYMPDPEAIGATANYVFPAVRGIGPPTGHSQKLKSMFEMTDPVVWGSLRSGVIAAIVRFFLRMLPGKRAPERITSSPQLMKSIREKQEQLEPLAKSPLV